MSDTTFAACGSCSSEGEIQLPHKPSNGYLACPSCGQMLTMISVEPWRRFTESRVAEFAAKQRVGAIGSRKQARSRSDAEISRDGLEAELAACLLLCPERIQDWMDASGPNRGKDFLSEWTKLLKPIEVKQTRYCDERRGCLLVRPPRNTPGPMLTKYIDDSIYLLMHGQNGLYTFLGWTDRVHLLSAGELNPIPVYPGQRECWGMHWRNLLPPSQLATVARHAPIQH